MKTGFIGLGNAGGNLAGSLLRNGFDLTVLDLDRTRVDGFVERGASGAETPEEIARECELVITCLPSPEASALVLEGRNGVLAALSKGQIWAEMSTTSESEVLRLGKLVEALGAHPVDCPVSGGCHRAATGNISIFAGCERTVFERMMPVLSAMGRRILHTGRLGSASILKVVTNYLATANLVSLCEALATSKRAGMDLNTAYEAIRISSGNSFVHETESQVILNGSRNINFTMDLVVKDLSLFQEAADRAGVPLELSPLLLKIFREGERKYGSREWSPNIVRRLEEAIGTSIIADGFPSEIVDREPEAEGREIVVRRKRNNPDFDFALE
ncbi:MAG: NAD(P)-dependent oxidoreductase [Albidovulum sp.]|nr:NAD(P)-dependent oxidoreductase [Albidovulum sp.]